jgi:hypothetical protein
VFLLLTRADYLADATEVNIEALRELLKPPSHGVEQLGDETAAIYRAFPSLRQAEPRKSASGAAEAPTRRRRRRKLSAEARKRISDAQKARWAKQKAQAAPTPSPKTARKKK